MHFSFYLLPICIRSAIGLRLPANAAASITAAPELQPRAAPSLPCNFSPTNGLPPICLGSFPNSLATSSSAASSSAPAPTAAPTCFQQDQDPDEGTNQQGCICNVGTTTKTLPLFKSGGDPSSSCAWPNLDQSTSLKITTNFGSVTTKSAACSVCTPTAIGRETCTSIPKCLPETPSIIVEVGTSPVPVATLTSSALFTSLSSAISVLCLPSTTLNHPSATVSCDETAAATIEGIAYLGADGESGRELHHDGEIVISIGSWGSSSVATMMTLIGMAAQSFVSSATGKNCHDETWTQTGGLPRRWEGSVLHPREQGPGASGSNGDGEPPPQVEHQSLTVCNMGGFVAPQYFAQDWRLAASPGPSAHLDVEAKFQVGTNDNPNLICEFIDAALELLESEYTPELLPEEQLADADINMACTDVYSSATSILGALPTP